MSADWKVERDGALAELTKDAWALMVGKTVSSVVGLPHSPDCDGENVLRVEFTDGTVVRIEGGYGAYTGRSCDEYIEFISVGADNGGAS